MQTFQKEQRMKCTITRELLMMRKIVIRGKKGIKQIFWKKGLYFQKYRINFDEQNVYYVKENRRVSVDS